MHCMFCIALYALHDMQCTQCYALFAMLCIIRSLFNASLLCIVYTCIFIMIPILLIEFELTWNLVAFRLANPPTER